MKEDELELLRRANPVHSRTGDRLAAPHSATFREAIGSGGNSSGRGRATGQGGSKQQFRLALAAAAVTLVALPTMLLVGDNTDEVIVRTPATNGSVLADDQALPTTTDDDWIQPTVTTEQDLDGPIGVTGDDVAPSSTVAATTSTTTIAPAEPAKVVDASAAVPVVPGPATAGAPDDAATASSAPTASSDATPGGGDAGAAQTPVTVAPAPLPAATVPTSTAPVAPPASTTAPEPDPPAQRSTPATNGPFDPATDLLVVTFDFAHLDDGHATVATRELAETYGFDPVVVAGTAAPGSGRFTHDYASVMSAAWGGGWLDAGADRAAARADMTQRWLSVIDSGGEIWVAEGGVSDFTGAVLADVRQQRPGLDTRAIVHVVHHISRNLDGTQRAERQLLDAHTDVVRIDDGNNVNGTAGLNGASSSFESVALAGPSAPMWTTAFDYFPASSLDFSDTVTVLHALGIGIDVVANVDDFAAVVMR